MKITPTRALTEGGQLPPPYTHVKEHIILQAVKSATQKKMSQYKSYHANIHQKEQRNMENKSCIYTACMSMNCWSFVPAFYDM